MLRKMLAIGRWLNFPRKLLANTYIYMASSSNMDSAAGDHLPMNYHLKAYFSNTNTKHFLVNLLNLLGYEINHLTNLVKRFPGPVRHSI